MIRTAAELEAAYGRDTMPRGFLASTPRFAKPNMHFIANRRCAQLWIIAGCLMIRKTHSVDVGKRWTSKKKRIF